MKNFIKIIFLVGLVLLPLCMPSWSIARADDRQTNDGRFSPHYYTVRNILRNHGSLVPPAVPGSTSLLGTKTISMAQVELKSDVAFENGVYEFQARLESTRHLVRLRKQSGKWRMDVYDETGARLTARYTLHR